MNWIERIRKAEFFKEGMAWALDYNDKLTAEKTRLWRQIHELRDELGEVRAKLEDLQKKSWGTVESKDRLTASLAAANEMIGNRDARIYELNQQVAELVRTNSRLHEDVKLAAQSQATVNAYAKVETLVDWCRKQLEHTVDFERLLVRLKGYKVNLTMEPSGLWMADIDLNPKDDFDSRSLWHTTEAHPTAASALFALVATPAVKAKLR